MTFIAGAFELTNVSVVLLLHMRTCKLQYRKKGGKANNNDLKNCSKFIFIFDLIVQKIVVIYKSVWRFWVRINQFDSYHKG